MIQYLILEVQNRTVIENKHLTTAWVEPVEE